MRFYTENGREVTFRMKISLMASGYCLL